MNALCGDESAVLRVNIVLYAHGKERKIYYRKLGSMGMMINVPGRGF
jgi:hypothetical protein